jgi:hypothetical protein
LHAPDDALDDALDDAPGDARIARRRLHRVTFVVAGLYNIGWGLWSALDPQWLFRFAGMTPMLYPEIFACLAMVIGIYGLLYLEVARVPERGAAIAAVGLLGKLLGPIGFAVLVASGRWPERAAVLVLTNDLIWWPSFTLYLVDAVRASRRERGTQGGLAMSRTMLAVLVAALVAATGRSPLHAAGGAPPAAKESTTSGNAALAALDADIDRLREVANGFPPHFTSDAHRAEISALYASLERRLAEGLAKAPGDYELLVRAGDVHRMGHNLDVEDADEKAVGELERAIAVAPEKPLPRLLLGIHYAGSNRAAEGEKALLGALERSDDELRPAILRGLAFACYFERKYADTVRYADQLLALDPSSSQGAFLKERAEAALRGDFTPKTVVLPAASPTPSPQRP